jgi:hypothetical protein
MDQQDILSSLIQSEQVLHSALTSLGNLNLTEETCLPEKVKEVENLNLHWTWKPLDGAQ